MARLINIVHYGRDRSTRFVVDEEMPEIVERNGYRYVDDGCFYFTIERGNERLTVKLTAAETALLAVRLQAAINSHAIAYMDKNAELSMLLKGARNHE